jgi:predicted Zn-dependent protease
VNSILLKNNIIFPIFCALLISTLCVANQFHFSVAENTNGTSAKIESAGSPGHSPKADAGGNKIVKAGDKVTLDASQSTDPDNDPLKYSWKLIAPKKVKLDIGDFQQSAIIFVAPSPGLKKELTLVFKLTVSDGKFLSSDIARVQVVSDSKGEPIQKGTRTVTVTDSGEPSGKFSEQDLCGDGTYAYSYMTAGVKWRTFPVTFAVDPTNSHMDPSLAKAAIRNVFSAYDAQINPTITNFKETSTFSSAQIKISWRAMDGPYGQLGYTSYSYRLDTKALLSATVYFDSGDKFFASPTERCGASGIYFDLQNIATHEIGHAMNMGHVSDRLQSMYSISYAGETLKRSLGNGDKLGLKSLYG